MKEKIFIALENIGIFISDDEKNKNLNLHEILIESIQMISFIFELESVLDMDLPYEIFLDDSLNSIFAFEQFLNNLEKD